MDLSKAFDTISGDLLIAKLHVYSFSEESLKLIKSYLTNRWQRTNLDTRFHKWTDRLLGVTQESVFGPLLFNIYINDLAENSKVCDYPDNTEFCVCNSNLQNLILR